MRTVRAAIAALSLLAVCAPAAHVDAASKTHEGKKKPRSIGAPNHGKLEGASKLHAGRHLALRQGARPFGVPELTHMLQRASDKVASKHGGSVLLVGDLSGKEGGQLVGHGSHQSGRDADVGFYVENSRGKPVKAMKTFVSFDDKGEGREIAWAHFDDARNWALVEALLKDKDATVKYIFVVNALRARLLAYATKHHATKELLQRAAVVMMSPQDADLHDNHFHVRIACPEASRGACVEEAGARGVAAVAEGPRAADASPAAVEPPPGEP